MKKSLVIGLFAVFLMGNTAFGYTDTKEHWAEKEIDKLSLNGIVTGYSDNSFRPDKNMTRAELVTVINRLLGNSVQNTKYVPDINSRDWFYTEIRKGIESGIIQGNIEGYVRPNDLVTREEAVVMLQRALVPIQKSIIVHEYNDSSEISVWSKAAMDTFVKEGYINGYNDNTIRPNNYITRAEVVKIIENIIDFYVTYGELSGEVHGNILVLGKNVKLNNLTIDGNLIVAEGALDTLELKNIIIEGDLILRTEVKIPGKNFELKGKTYNIISNSEQNISNYINDEYGISFSIPEKGTVVYIEENGQKVNYKTKNLITIRVNQNEDLYFTTFDSGLFKERKRFDLPYEQMATGKIGRHKYAVYGSEKDDSYFVYLKRDNVEYSIYFYNIENINVIDSLVNSIKLYDGTKVDEHIETIYRNRDLYLKFSYINDYVSVDDSYNTGVVNDADAFFKMFIQVTNIIDMSDYTIDELKDILVSLEDSDGEIIDTKVKKVYTYDAIEYTVRNDDKLTKSLYIVISTKLYHFIFTGDESKMNTVGIEHYNDIINSIEF